VVEQIKISASELTGLWMEHRCRSSNGMCKETTGPTGSRWVGGCGGWYPPDTPTNSNPKPYWWLGSG